MALKVISLETEEGVPVTSIREGKKDTSNTNIGEACISFSKTSYFNLKSSVCVSVLTPFFSLPARFSWLHFKIIIFVNLFGTDGFRKEKFDLVTSIG